MQRRKLSVGLLVIGSAVFAAAGRLAAAEVTVFAAASLTDALKGVAAGYEDGTGDRLVFNFAASSTLARQIGEGAPADVFFSADEAKMVGLEKQGMLVAGTRVSLLSNSLVVVVAAEGGVAIERPEDLAGPAVKRIALAEPRTVPAGIYAKAYLEKLGLWPAVEGKVVPTENVRAALAAVGAGNVDAGIVYKTDAAISDAVKVAVEVPAGDGPAISYPVAAVAGSPQPEAAKRFLAHLATREAARVFERFGFIVRE
jgi:molybdate transport system substrate-binding protein